jgi:hypothetical protein
MKPAGTAQEEKTLNDIAQFEKNFKSAKILFFIFKFHFSPPNL